MFFPRVDPRILWAFVIRSFGDILGFKSTVAAERPALGACGGSAAPHFLPHSDTWSFVPCPRPWWTVLDPKNPWVTLVKVLTHPMFAPSTASPPHPSPLQASSPFSAGPASSSRTAQHSPSFPDLWLLKINAPAPPEARILRLPTSNSPCPLRLGRAHRRLSWHIDFQTF